MTVIAWDGRTLAADKRTSFGGLIATTAKLHRLNDGIAGGTGDSALIGQMIDWLRQGADPEKFPTGRQRDPKECAEIMVIQRGRILYYVDTAYPAILEDRQWACGSGRDFALMAMHLGKTAREAVELACLFQSDCGNGVDELTL